MIGIENVKHYCADLDANCSVVVGVSIIDNFAEYLQESIQNDSNTRQVQCEDRIDIIIIPCMHAHINALSALADVASN